MAAAADVACGADVVAPVGELALGVLARAAVELAADGSAVRECLGPAVHYRRGAVGVAGDLVRCGQCPWVAA
eukprot:6921736-Heterocapsa_arctica.AAC.1